jgi:hypothetical protein
MFKSLRVYNIYLVSKPPTYQCHPPRDFWQLPDKCPNCNNCGPRGDICMTCINPRNYYGNELLGEDTLPLLARLMASAIVKESDNNMAQLLCRGVLPSRPPCRPKRHWRPQRLQAFFHLAHFATLLCIHIHQHFLSWSTACISYTKTILPNSGLRAWTMGWLRGRTGVVRKAIAV